MRLLTKVLIITKNLLYSCLFTSSGGSVHHYCFSLDAVHAHPFHIIHFYRAEPHLYIVLEYLDYEIPCGTKTQQKVPSPEPRCGTC